MSVLTGAALMCVGCWLVLCVSSLALSRRPAGQTVADHLIETTLFFVWVGVAPWIGIVAFGALLMAFAKLVSLVR